MSRSNLDRRALLMGGALSGLGLLSSRAHGALRTLASGRLEGEAPRTLVVLQLAGGNDGLNTLVPFADDAYHAARPRIGLRSEDVLALDDYRGLHPQLQRMRAHFDEGRLAIVQGAGYPNPIRSHFKSFEIWHTADERGRRLDEGWIGRLARAAWPENTDPNLVVHVGGNVPYSLRSRTHPPASFLLPRSYRWVGDERETEAYESSGDDALGHGSNLDFLRRVLADGQSSSARVRRAAAEYRTEVEYPVQPLGGALRDVAALVNAGMGSRIFSVELPGFDTHANQLNRHNALMRTLDAALGAFLEDLQRSEAGKETAVVVFSEFGRRVEENAAGGTDHGVAGPMFVCGPRVKGGLYGEYPSLTELDEGDLVHAVDFRSVYGTLIERWLGVEHERVLDTKYPLLDLV